METSPEPQQERESGAGPIAGVIIIVSIMLLGGIYFLLMETNQEEPASPYEPGAQEE